MSDTYVKKSQLLLPTFDAQLTELKIIPKCHNTKVSYKLKMYDEALQQKITKTMCFKDVVAISFHMNYFDNLIGAEVSGFYEIFQREKKEEMLERNFISRKNNYLFHGDYDYDPAERNDLLNNRESIESILREIELYHLYEQQTTGGTYLLLAKQWSIEGIPV